jgi:hypothetical protein
VLLLFRGGWAQALGRVLGWWSGLLA